MEMQNKMASKEYYDWQVRVGNQLQMLKEMINEEPDYTERLGIIHEIICNLVDTYAKHIPDRIGLLETAKLTLFEKSKRIVQYKTRENYIKDKKKIDEAVEDNK